MDKIATLLHEARIQADENRSKDVRHFASSVVDCVEDLRQQLASADESNKAVERALKDVDYRGSYADGVEYLKQQLASLVQGIKIQVPSNTMEQAFSNYHRLGYNKAKKECEQQLAAALAACEAKDECLAGCFGDINPERGYADELEQEIANALAIKPDASALKAHDEELIERCACICDDMQSECDGMNDAQYDHQAIGAEKCAAAIRELKDPK